MKVLDYLKRIVGYSPESANIPTDNKLVNSSFYEPKSKASGLEVLSLKNSQ